MEFRIDRQAVRRSFNRASKRYARAAKLQTSVNAELLERLQYFRLEPRVIVDLGCGSGSGATALRARFPRARVIALDLGLDMVREAKRRQRFWRRYECVCADAMALPFAAQSVDLVYSNLMVQWCDDPPALFAQMHQALRPGGLVLFSTFGPDTLHELRSAWASGDEQTHVSAFADMPQLAEAMSRAGLAEPVMDRESITHYYAHVDELMSELRSIGARHAAADRRRTLTGRGRVIAMNNTYETLRTSKGVPASWEILYGAAFAGSSQQMRHHDHSASTLAESTVAVSSIGTRGQSGRGPSR